MDLIGMAIVAGGGHSQQGDKIMGIAALSLAAVAAAGIVLLQRRRKDR
jgi:hypothetical protein